MGALITLSITEFTLLLHQEKINNLFLKQKYWFSIFMHATSIKLNSPTTLVFCRKVDLKVIIVIMDIKKTTSFIKLGNAVKFTLGEC